MSERRQAQRGRVHLGGRITHPRIRSETNCLLRDLSPGGARIIVSGTVPLPDRFDLIIDCRETTRQVELVWRKGDAVGVRFTDRGCATPADPARSRAQIEAAFDRRSGDRRLH